MITYVQAVFTKFVWNMDSKFKAYCSFLCSVRVPMKSLPKVAAPTASPNLASCAFSLAVIVSVLCFVLGRERSFFGEFARRRGAREHLSGAEESDMSDSLHEQRRSLLFCTTAEQ